MAARTPRSCLLKFVEGSAEPLRLCHACGFLPMASFYASSVKRGIYDCKSCIKKGRGDYFHTPHGRNVFCAAEIRRREGIAFTAGDVAEVLERYGGVCFVSGKRSSGAKAAGALPCLTLIKCAKDQPFSVGNSVPCCRSMARTLGWQLPPHLIGAWKEAARGKVAPHNEDGARAPLNSAAEEDKPVNTASPARVSSAPSPPVGLIQKGCAPLKRIMYDREAIERGRERLKMRRMTSISAS